MRRDNKKTNQFMKKRSNKKINPWLFWTPRILSIIFILFLAMFSLDIFDGSSSLSQILLGLLMHNIPVFILIIILLISWKHELIGTIAFALAGLLYLAMILKNIFTDFSLLYQLVWTLPISVPAFVIAGLFYLNYKNKKK